MAKVKTIRVCDQCKAPMIWTFAFAYCERYCVNCGYSGGMLGTGKDVPETRELIFKKKLAEAVWKVIYGNKGLMPNCQFTRSNCEKCRTDDDHRRHATAAEIQWNEIAKIHLESVKGILDVWKD